MLRHVSRRSPDGEGVTIDGGKGIGRVTKPGLTSLWATQPSIPDRGSMIRAAVEAVCSELHYEGGIDGDHLAPEGEKAAEKTFNAKLGIEGGISILGTTGIVEPMSEQALVDTIEIELKQTALDSDRLIITPGNYGEDFIAGTGWTSWVCRFRSSRTSWGDAGHSVGADVEEVLLVAHVGKLSKVAAGIMNTHSKYADGRNEVFCAHAAICGGSTDLCRALMDAATTDACIEILDEQGERGFAVRS